jgi:hypothetical protein
MFRIGALALAMAAALVKLGVASVMVGMLSAVLWATFACLAVLLGRRGRPREARGASSQRQSGFVNILQHFCQRKEDKSV